MNLTARAARCVIGACAVSGVVIGVPAAALAAAAVQAPSRPATGAQTRPQAVAGSHAPVPKGFIANSITWISPGQGWILGAAPCGKSICSDVVGTTNAGASWSLVGAVGAGIPKLGNPGKGITEIRFASARRGWAFAPGLFRTTDGGRTWAPAPIPGHGKQVLALAVDSAGAYAIVSRCGFETGLCRDKSGTPLPLTLWRTTAAGHSWTRVPVNLHGNVTADVAVFGETVYVVNPRIDGPNPSQLYASTEGRHFTVRHVPCTASEEYNLIEAVPSSATRVAFLCDGNPGFGKAVKAVYRSANTGRTDSYAGIMNLFGIQAQLAVSPSGNLAVAAWSIGSFMDINDTHKTTWHMIIGSGDGGAGWNDVVYVTSKRAWVVYGPADMFSGYGQIYVTQDAGRHWSLVKL